MIKQISAASLALALSCSGAAARYNPVVQQAQTILDAQGFEPGAPDGSFGARTARALEAFQNKNGLKETGDLDAPTLQKLSIDTAANKPVADWRAPPAQAEIDGLTGKPINDPATPYTDYRPDAPGAGLALPGAAILAAMNESADIFGSRGPGGAKHTDEGYKYATGCLKTGYAPTHWSDLAIHYYCQMSKPRACYTYALAGKSTPPGKKYTRPDAYRGCVAGKLAEAADFVFVSKTQPLVFQYVMFGQTHAFDHAQEQSIINAFYGVSNPADRTECARKRPRRKEDPTDGTHCLANKVMSLPLRGKSE